MIYTIDLKKGKKVFSNKGYIGNSLGETLGINRKKNIIRWFLCFSHCNIS